MVSFCLYFSHFNFNGLVVLSFFLSLLFPFSSWLQFIYGDRKSALRAPFKPRKSDVHHHNLSEHLLVPPPTELAALLPHKKHVTDPSQASANGSTAPAVDPTASSASTSQPGDIEVLIEDVTKSTIRNRHDNFTNENENTTTDNAGHTRLVEDDARPHRSLVCSVLFYCDNFLFR